MSEVNKDKRMKLGRSKFSKQGKKKINMPHMARKIVNNNNNNSNNNNNNRIPYCAKRGCGCAPGFRVADCGCRQCNSGSAAADPTTRMETAFDNMMDPFMPIYNCVNFVCRGRNCNYSYAEKCRCLNTDGCTGNCRKNCDNDNSMNIFDRENDAFDNEFNFNNNNLGRPFRRCSHVERLPFAFKPINDRCFNPNALNDFDLAAERFENRFLAGNFDFQEA